MRTKKQCENTILFITTIADICNQQVIYKQMFLDIEATWNPIKTNACAQKGNVRIQFCLSCLLEIFATNKKKEILQSCPQKFVNFRCRAIWWTFWVMFCHSIIEQFMIVARSCVSLSELCFMAFVCLILKFCSFQHLPAFLRAFLVVVVERMHLQWAIHYRTDRTDTLRQVRVFVNRNVCSRHAVFARHGIGVFSFISNAVMWWTQ